MRDVWKVDASDRERRLSSLELSQAFLRNRGGALIERGRQLVAASEAIAKEIKELE